MCTIQKDVKLKEKCIHIAQPPQRNTRNNTFYLDIYMYIDI